MKTKPKTDNIQGVGFIVLAMLIFSLQNIAIKWISGDYPGLKSSCCAVLSLCLPTCEELGIGLVSYSPLGRGDLTGKINENSTFADNDIRARNPRFTQEAIKANRVVVDLLERVGAQKGATPAQIALAWLLAQKPWIVPIPGSRKLHRLDENIGSVDIELTSDNLSEIANAMSQINVIGIRTRTAWAA